MLEAFENLNLAKSMTREQFIESMMQGVDLAGIEAFKYGIHLQAVWRGKAAPSLIEFQKAQCLKPN